MLSFMAQRLTQTQDFLAQLAVQPQESTLIRAIREENAELVTDCLEQQTFIEEAAKKNSEIFITAWTMLLTRAMHNDSSNSLPNILEKLAILENAPYHYCAALASLAAKSNGDAAYVCFIGSQEFAQTAYAYLDVMVHGFSNNSDPQTTLKNIKLLLSFSSVQYLAPKDDNYLLQAAKQLGEGGAEIVAMLQEVGSVKAALEETKKQEKADQTLVDVLKEKLTPEDFTKLCKVLHCAIILEGPIIHPVYVVVKQKDAEGKDDEYAAYTYSQTGINQWLTMQAQTTSEADSSQESPRQINNPRGGVIISFENEAKKIFPHKTFNALYKFIRESPIGTPLSDFRGFKNPDDGSFIAHPYIDRNFGVVYDGNDSEGTRILDVDLQMLIQAINPNPETKPKPKAETEAPTCRLM